jgi:tRNA(His) guanylyltransferase
MVKLSDRMKGYERVSDLVLPSRLPVILRLDGNSFSKLTSGSRFEKPFDLSFIEAMDEAAREVLSYCSGAQFAYIQSDEISILLRNDQTHQTEPFLANRVQKITSLTAAKASVAFNKKTRDLGIETEAIFDCRVFVVPPQEVNNYFLWRQEDCFKNCMSSYAYWKARQAHGRKTALKMLDGKNTEERQEILFQLGINANDVSTSLKRGRVIHKETYEVPLREVMDPEVLEKLCASGKIEDSEQFVTRSRWVTDEEIPLFNLDSTYVGKYLGGQFEET